MTLFKKKPQNKSAIIYLLEDRLEIARENKENSFYYLLTEGDLKLVRPWAEHHGIVMQVDHITDGNIFYKFYGYKI